MEVESEMNPKDTRKLEKLIAEMEKREKDKEEWESKAKEELVKEGFPLEGGTTYPPEDYPRTGPIGPGLRRRVLDTLRRKGYDFEGRDEAWEESNTGIIVYFNWAPLWRIHDESEFEEYGWGRIFVDAFARSDDVGKAQARLEAGRIARIIKGLPGIKGRHFVGVVLCEGL